MCPASHRKTFRNLLLRTGGVLQQQQQQQVPVYPYPIRGNFAGYFAYQVFPKFTVSNA